MKFFIAVCCFLLMLSNIKLEETNPDPNFYIFLAFGQSNMEGQGDIEQQDKEVSERFKVYPAVNMTIQKREVGSWYTAVPPLCRQWTRISPLDNFGKTLVEKLPEDVKVGVISVAVGGASIDVFDEDKVEEYLNSTESWIKSIAAEYNNHPFNVLVERAKEAQKYGVIKGVLLHQGESDNGDEEWPNKVKTIYEKLLNELSLKQEEVPLLVGELLSEAQGGNYASHNEIIAKVPSVIENSYVISSENCTSQDDGMHFSTEGYRLLGKRYAEKMLEVLKKSVKPDPNFYIFLAFGQSNMEGQADIEEADQEVSKRFKMMSAINMTLENRVEGNWYTAYPPLCRQWTRISPLDYFGKNLVEKLPEDVKVGVISVAVGGGSIDVFDEDKVEEYLNNTAEGFTVDIAASYGNNPFKVLVERAKAAQKDGVIKGVLLHQGESDNGDEEWPNKVKTIYERLLKELSLKQEEVPLLVGELLSSEQGGLFSAHNAIIAKVPDVISNSFVISSSDCTSQGDGYHFSKAGYKLLGERYAQTMLQYLEKNIKPDPNFYIFLAFGQSNMEGQGDIEQQDKEVSERFKMMPAIDMTRKNRVAGEWYTAVPPLCREWTRISPLDNFGKVLVENLAEDVKVGVISVAVGGASIDVFNEDKVEEYLNSTESWVKSIAEEYGNHPFKVLINRAKEAQRDGVIKGILLHQGESDNGDEEWPEKVKTIYDRILNELSLKEEKFPILVGELLSEAEGGNYAKHNEIIAKIPDVISNSYVISSENCTSQGDGMHFSTEGYRLLGERYAEAMLKFLRERENDK